MPSDTTLSVLQEATGYRLRRSHEKSRNGCLRCKKQRKKCDELRPSCTRCTKRAYRCRYQSDGNESEDQDSTHLLIPDLHVPPTSSSSGTAGSESPLELTRDGHSVPSTLSGGQAASVASFTAEEERLPSNSSSPGPLDATELRLLAHYISHTSQTIPVDDLDLYALSVGVPNLAFNCKLVMSSLLALAAACKSHDIAKQVRPPLDDQSLMNIQGLLTLAERHHRDSLQHIQVAVQNSDSYDYLLANAALMVLYASASHSIRVHLAVTAKQFGQRLPNDVLPQHSQWISFTRAAHTASTAVLNDIVNAADRRWTAASSPVLDAPNTQGTEYSTGVLSPQDGPSDNTKRLFLPLVASTYGRALESLRGRAESAEALLERPELSAHNHLQLRACLETVSVLDKCAFAALSRRDDNTKSDNFRHNPTSFDGLSRVSSWVARYMISVTSMESPRVLRRIIMSFLNEAPAEFLNLVQSVLDSRSTEPRADIWISRVSLETWTPSLSATHVLAMDIFAHWLVLVMLLDGVWWIGDIGQWELGQIMPLMKAQNRLGQPADNGETWWPESMYLIKRELNANFQH